jgi:hypothetical protein
MIMLKKISVVFVVLLVFIIAASAAFAGNPDGTGDTNAPAPGAAQNNGSPAGPNVVPDGENPGETGTETAPEDQENAADEGETEDPDAAFRSAIQRVLDAGVPVDNGQFIVTITKPENIGEKMSTYGREFEITGITEYTDVEIKVARLNGETGAYEIIELPDGDEVINAGAGAFSKILELEYGENNLLIIAYRFSEKDESRIQYNSISVTALRRTLEQMLIRFRNSLIDFFSGAVR